MNKCEQPRHIHIHYEQIKNALIVPLGLRIKKKNESVALI